MRLDGFKQRTAQRIDELMTEALHEQEGWTLGEYYVSVMEGILGQPIEDNRKLDNVYARVVITYELYAAGWTLMKIGSLFGRHHATLIHLIRMMRGTMETPTSNPQLYFLYKKFKQAIENDQQGL